MKIKQQILLYEKLNQQMFDFSAPWITIKRLFLDESIKNVVNQMSEWS